MKAIALVDFTDAVNGPAGDVTVAWDYDGDVWGG
jgi:hypothetical protein